MTSSTPEAPAGVTLEVYVRGRLAPSGAEIPGFGALRVVSRGHAPGAEVLLHLGNQQLTLTADDDGEAEHRDGQLLGLTAGRMRVRVGELERELVVRPRKLVAEELYALIQALESLSAALSQDLGGVATLERERPSLDEALSALERAVGLAASAAPSIRRRPVHRAREERRATPDVQGARRPADLRWLATHPAQVARAAAQGRAVGVSRERRADLDTLENRGVLSAYDRIDAGVETLLGVVSRHAEALSAARPAREALLTEAGDVWSEHDAPRLSRLREREARLRALGAESRAVRLRAGLPDLRPRTAAMVRTPRADAEPAYWTTARAYALAEAASLALDAPTEAPLASLDELWERYCAVVTLQLLTAALGPPHGGESLTPGWLSSLRRGEAARWNQPRRVVRLLLEPEYHHRPGAPMRKLHPGRPWRPDLVLDIRHEGGQTELHLLDAKFRRDPDGGPPLDALRDLWWRYGESIGDHRGAPLVSSIWGLWPGDGLRLVGPTMLDAAWPRARLRGGLIGLRPGQRHPELERTLAVLLGA
ncbi:hypothetical protein L6R49_29100 [Myxococcota bacterium]|nr:hypothetical protein [Myxococcota bacterium]